MSVSVGQAAPDFTLTDHQGNQHTLTDYRGRRVVLMFFPKAFTGICTGEVCTLRDRSAEFSNDDTVLLSVSCDQAPSLAKFAEVESVNYPLLSDFWPHGEVAQSYGVFVDKLGVATRATFLIDREGTVRWSVVNGLGDERSADDYAAALADIA